MEVSRVAVVHPCWVYFAVAAVRRRLLQLRPSLDDDTDGSSDWGTVPTSFLRTFLAVVVVIGWEGRSMDRRQ
jgi:hypothetical protein